MVDRPHRQWLPSFILIATLLLTTLYSYYAFAASKEKDQLRFENAVQQTESKIENRIETYTALLRASSGLFVRSTNVSRQEFQTYVERLDLRRRYPGIQGIGYSARVFPDQVPDLVAEMQGQGVENFTLRPESPRSEYHVILYLEPSDTRNQAAIGFDMFTETARRAAMEKARDTGEPAASARVTLIQEKGAQKQAGFLIYMPIYQGGRVPATVSDRRAALQGFVYSPFRADDFLASVFGDESQLLVDFQVYDGLEVRPDKLLHENLQQVPSSNAFQATRRLTIAGEPWTLVFFPRPELAINSEMRRVPYILIGGGLVSFVLFLITQSQIRARRAAELATFDLRRSQSALHQSESRLRRLIDANIIGIIISNVNGEVLEANDAFLNMIGYSREEVMTGAVNWREITPPEYLPLDDRGREELQQRGSHEPYEKAYIRKDGTRVPVVIGTALLEDENLGIGFMLDISERVRVEEERKRVEDALQRTNDRLGLLYAMSSSLLLQEHPREFINRLFSQLSHHLQLDVYLNYLFEDQHQRLHLNAYHDSSTSVAPAEWIDLGESICGMVASERRAIVLENVQKSDDPQTETIHAIGLTAYACYPLLSRGHLLGTFSFGTRDRPRFRRDELALMQVACEQVAAALERSRLLTDLQRQTEELTQANRMKDEFLSVLSHELRTPLNSMMGWTKLLRTRKMDEKTAARALETLDRNTHSLAQLIEDILDISRVITGKLLLNLIELDLISVIGSALQTIQPAADAKDIRIQTQFDVERVPILADPSRLQQILWNLISNAIKFTPNGGQVTIGVTLLDGQVQLQVRDTGRGINAEFLPHVFDRFRQADSSTTRAHGGLGLGLAIVRHLVELHKGTIQAESPGEGQGATFTLTLPLRSSIPIAQS